MEVFLWLLDIGRESVARVKGPVEFLVQSWDVEVPLLTLIRLEIVLVALCLVTLDIQHDIVSVKVVAFPRVEETSPKVYGLSLLGKGLDDQLGRVLLLRDNQGGTDPSATRNIDILEAENWSDLEQGGRADGRVALACSLDGNLVIVVFVEQRVAVLLASFGLDVLLLGMVFVVLARHKVGNCVSNVRKKGHGDKDEWESEREG
jgi:hypothetical protein